MFLPASVLMKERKGFAKCCLIITVFSEIIENLFITEDPGFQFQKINLEYTLLKIGFLNLNRGI